MNQPISRRAIPVGILGASGTSGAELTRLVEDHPDLELRFATSRSAAGRSLCDLDPACPDVPLVHPDDADLGSVELVFTCLPHGASAPIVKDVLAAGPRVVDLSGDYRLRDAGLHTSVYGSPRDPAVAERAVYGLTELTRREGDRARLVANPGCYPTCAALGLAPLVARDMVDGPVIIDAKSGVSGAGRSPKTGTLFVSVVDDVRPYKLGAAHRHRVEIAQTLQRVAPDGKPAPTVIFNPHVVPIERGMLATMVVRTPGHSAADVLDALRETYAGEPLIEVRDQPARIRAVARTPRAQLGVSDVAGTDHVVVTSTIDNLGKGAAAQAIQNANRMLGLPETLGLVPGVLARSDSP